MPDQVFPEFPYERRFTKEQLAEISDEAEKLADALRDGLAPNGAQMFMDEGYLQLICVHGALAGVRVHPELAYIVAVPRPDEHLQMTGSVDWKLREDLPADFDEQQVEAEAQAVAKALTERLPDDVRRRTAALMTAGFEALANPQEDQ
jgi:hypothetical protein